MLNWMVWENWKVMQFDNLCVRLKLCSYSERHHSTGKKANEGTEHIFEKSLIYRNDK